MSILEMVFRLLLLHLLPQYLSLCHHTVLAKMGWMTDTAPFLLCDSEILKFCRTWMPIWHIYQSTRSDISELIRNHLRLFSDIPSQTVLSHDIDVGDHRPIKQHVYRVHPTKYDVMQQEAKYLLENGFAVPSNSAWSSPSLLVPKSD